jgi:hypothetical protein
VHTLIIVPLIARGVALGIATLARAEPAAIARPAVRQRAGQHQPPTLGDDITLLLARTTR